jgi:hypothetical protein
MILSTKRIINRHDSSNSYSSPSETSPVALRGENLLQRQKSGAVHDEPSPPRPSCAGASIRSQLLSLSIVSHLAPDEKIAVRAARHRAEIDHRVAHRLAVRERIRYDAARHKIDAALRIEFSPGSRLPNE